MSFLLHGLNNYIFFVFYNRGKKVRYSTKIKIDREEWDLNIQRPKARRGAVGEANRKITYELNEYQKKYDELKRYYKESLTKEIVKNRWSKTQSINQLLQVLKIKAL